MLNAVNYGAFFLCTCLVLVGCKKLPGSSYSIAEVKEFCSGSSTNKIGKVSAKQDPNWTILSVKPKVCGSTNKTFSLENSANSSGQYKKAIFLVSYYGNTNVTPDNASQLPKQATTRSVKRSP